MTDHRLITADEARALIDGTAPGPWWWFFDNGIIYLQGMDGAAIATGLTDADADLLAASSDLAHTVIAQAEQIEKLHDAVDGLKCMAESSMHIADTTATAAGLSHLIDADGDGDWQTIWERVWGKLEEHKAQAEQIKRLQAAVNELLSEYNRLDIAEQLMHEPYEDPLETTYHDLGLTPEDMEDRDE